MEERAFATRVVRASRLSPTFVRVTVTGDSLAEFAGHGYDQRINLAFLTDPAEAAAYDADEDWYASWQATPAARRPALRATRSCSRFRSPPTPCRSPCPPASRWCGWRAAAASA